MNKTINRDQHQHEEPVAVIFAGGEGKRLWPISTKELPKQLDTQFSKKTLVGEAFERVSKLFPRERIIVVTTEILADKMKEIISLPEKNWIVQPDNADTAPAICLTALHLETLFPDSTAIIFYSDHKISNLVDFKKTIHDLVHIAPQYTSLITVGTKPTEPNTQFGYIKLGEQQKEKNLYTVSEFIEKPNEETAKKYLKSGSYVWNTGLYAWHSLTLLQTIKQVAPQYYADLLKLKLLIGSKEYSAAVDDWFAEVTRLSFEEAVSEKLKSMLVYVGDYRWDDVGNWKTVYELAPKDANDNAILEKKPHQKIHFLNTSGSMVLSDTEHIALVGLKDIVVVQTADSLLVCHKDHAGKVKELLEECK